MPDQDRKRRIKAAKKPTEQHWYKVTHHLYGTSTMYESWLELCESTLEIAEEAVYRTIKDSICLVADEMLNTAEEYVPETPNSLS